MRILSIETSCDETGVAVVDGVKTPGGFAFSVVANALLSQVPLHRGYGGVYPSLAKREHIKNLPVLLEQVLAEAGAEGLPEKIDAIAVTYGPGLEPALWTGVVFAEELAKKWQKPLFGVNHMEGHLMAALAKESSATESAIEELQFPLLGLLVSGGHTEFVISPELFSYRIIGETLDDAVGEAFDKVARMLGLPYPGGPEISKLAAEARNDGAVWRGRRKDPHLNPLPEGEEATRPLPRPMLRSNSCDVSFSGLKTAALYALRDIGGAEKLTPEEKAAFAREFEDAVTEVFLMKTRRAMEETDARTFALGGGVAANAHLRGALAEMVRNEFPGTDVRAPKPSAAGDNAIMIAQTALAHLLSGDWALEGKQPAEPLKAEGNLGLWTETLATPHPATP